MRAWSIGAGGSHPIARRCGTTLSSHEVAQGYKDDTPDPSIYVKFEVDPSSVPGPLAQHFRERSYLLAWTTTPWTLPGNTALSVSAEDEYALVQLTESGERLVLAKPLMEQAIRGEHTTLAQFKGSELVGLRYLPLYNPFDFGAEVHRFSEPGMNVLDRVTKGPERLTYPVITAEYVSMKRRHRHRAHGPALWRGRLQFRVGQRPVFRAAGGPWRLLRGKLSLRR